MQAKYKWLLVPPALALILFLGPLRDSRPTGLGGERAPAAPATAPVTAATGPTAAPGDGTAGDSLSSIPARPSLATSPIPSAWQIGSTLLGVLLLGGVVVMLLARARQSRVARGGDRVLALRETLRLTPKHSLHLVQFDDRLLLVGAAEHGIACVAGGDATAVPAALPAVRGRGAEADDATAADGDDDGAVPRDMIIPRPPANSAALADFRTLLRRARVAQEQR